MKKLSAITIFIIIIFIVLTGCQNGQADSTSEESAIIHSGDDSQQGEESSSGDSSQDDSQGASSEDSMPPDNNEEPLFTYNKYMITADAREYYSDEDYALYCKMVDSILAHDGVMEGFESEEQFDRIWGFLLSEFVPARSIVHSYISSNEPYVYENGTATLSFVGDKETCDENYRVFEAIINEALSLIKEDDSDWERIAKLYLYVTEHMDYGNPYEVYGVKADLYNCIKYKLGMCASYTFYLNMLANQIGFETIDGTSLGKDGFENADHAWSMIRVEGQWYHFDACWEASLLSHESMEYFAFSTEDRYYSLSHNSFSGEPGEVEMFRQHDYTYERSELPLCESGMDENERSRLYYAVIGEYINGVTNDIPEDMLQNLIDAAINEVADGIANGAELGVKFEIKEGMLNSHAADVIMKYSPQNLQDYPELENGGEKCTVSSVLLGKASDSEPA